MIWDGCQWGTEFNSLGILYSQISGTVIINDINNWDYDYAFIILWLSKYTTF